MVAVVTPPALLAGMLICVLVPALWYLTAKLVEANNENMNAQIWWRHQMETFSALLARLWGEFPILRISLGESCFYAMSSFVEHFKAIGE